MSNNKQTAVEWLVGQLTFKTSGGVYTTDGIDDVTNLVEQAKEMEKQQIVEAYRLGHIFHDSNDSNSAQEYYDTEYGKETSNN